MVGCSFTVIDNNDNIVPQGPSSNSPLMSSVLQRNIETGMLGHFTANADPGNWAYSYRFFLPGGWPGWPPPWGWSRADTVSVKLSRGSEEVSALDKHVNSGVKLSGF